MHVCECECVYARVMNSPTFEGRVDVPGGPHLGDEVWSVAEDVVCDDHEGQLDRLQLRLRYDADVGSRLVWRGPVGVVVGVATTPVLDGGRHQRRLENLTVPGGVLLETGTAPDRHTDLRVEDDEDEERNQVDGQRHPRQVQRQGPHGLQYPRTQAPKHTIQSQLSSFSTTIIIYHYHCVYTCMYVHV